MEKHKNRTQIDAIRNGIIDKLLAISDEAYLTNILHIVERHSDTQEKINLTEEQKLMLELSESDIQYGRLISQEDLDSKDLEWLKEK
jgi:hypothetical protein